MNGKESAFIFFFPVAFFATIESPKKKGKIVLKFLTLLIVSFFILSGCEGLPFTYEDIFNAYSKLETNKKETKEELNDFKPDNDLPYKKNRDF